MRSLGPAIRDRERDESLLPTFQSASSQDSFYYDVSNKFNCFVRFYTVVKCSLRKVVTLLCG